jgi:hypothetical protein
MATYLITYDDGNDQKLTVDNIEYDGDQYIARTSGQITAYIRPLDVRSIIRQDNQAETDSPLVNHARRELALIGEDEWLTNGLCEVVAAFAAMGHSGFSAEHSTGVLEKLLRYQPLSPITDDPTDWEDRSEMSGYSIWQNTRDSRAMSRDGGKTYTLVDEEQQDSESGQPVHVSQSQAVTG